MGGEERLEHGDEESERPSDELKESRSEDWNGGVIVWAHPSAEPAGACRPASKLTPFPLRLLSLPLNLFSLEKAGGQVDSSSK